MKLLLQTIKFILAVASIGSLHIAIAFLLPYPFSSIHIIFIAIIMILFLYEHGSIVWFGAILSMMLDFPSIEPTGVPLVAGVVATTTMLLLYRNIFTNRSLFAAIVLLSIGYMVYRTVFVMFDIMQYLVYAISFDILELMIIYITELSMTLMALVLVYSITAKFSFQLQHTHIQESWFRTLRNE
jgi:hypothetical protein